MQKPMPEVNGALPPPAEVRGLRKVYRDIAAVDGITFALRSGSITALLGGNGAGKTTTISMLMGLVVPTAGVARVFGFDMARERHKVLYRMNFESPYVDVPMRLTVRQNLEVYARLYGVHDFKGAIAAMADDLRLEALLDRPYGKLSAGQKTRVSLAKALINRPELLLLDEPTASLDPDSADWVRGKIANGRVIADEPPPELIARFGRSNLEEVFLAIARRAGHDVGRRP
jgi:ABC-2 type transport system ATP-binding protein